MMGANQSLLKLICELRPYGIEPVVLVPNSHKSEYDLRDQLDKECIPWIATKMRKAKEGSKLHCVSNFVNDQIYNRRTAKQIHGLQIDLVHSNSSLIDLGAYIAKDKGIPHVWHFREFGDSDYGMRTPFGKWFQRVIYSGRQNNFIAISGAIKDHYLPYISSYSRFSLIYNGVDPKRFHCEREERVDEVTHFCIVGLLHPAKGQMLALQAVKELIVGGYSDFDLTIIGSGEQPYVDELIAYADENGISQQVSFLGLRKDVPEILKRMDVGVMASSNEAFGRTTVEYMMSGLTVVASDSGANAELVTDMNTGLVFKSGSAKELAGRMAFCITNKAVAKEIALRGIKAALSKYSSATNALKVYNYYQEILVDSNKA